MSRNVEDIPWEGSKTFCKLRRFVKNKTADKHELMHTQRCAFTYGALSMRPIRGLEAYESLLHMFIQILLHRSY